MKKALIGVAFCAVFCANVFLLCEIYILNSRIGLLEKTVDNIKGTIAEHQDLIKDMVYILAEMNGVKKWKPLYIFDLDGTLALIDHRQHLVADKKHQRWAEFYRACVADEPNKPVIKIFNTLIAADMRDERFVNEEDKNDLLIFSGRSGIVIWQTLDWLIRNTDISPWYATRILKMRTPGDYTPDQILKKQWYDELSQEDKDRLVCVFDDRQKVVDMWRSIGVTCLQVAKGDC